MTPEQVERLTPGQRSAVLGLVASATAVDGVAPLSEQVLLAVQDTDTATGSSPSVHLLAYSGPHLTGYAHLDREVKTEAATAEVVVDPGWRRKGIGTQLVHALEDAAGDTDAARSASLHLWSHGDLEGARALARQGGYSVVRELWQMRRSLRPDVKGSGSLPEATEATLPSGFRARSFVVGRDEEAWLRVNARAFAHHPEQGRITRKDLDRRIAEPWFDARGFILIEDLRGPEPILAASHWTKVAAADDQTSHPSGPPTEGEVYVVGVDPAYQGMGLGRSVTLLGLTHLRAEGLAEAMLYVDEDNRAAVATYSRLDFTRTAVDIMYARIVHSPM